MSREIKFGTDGWRAIIGQDFNLSNVAALAQAIADYLLRTTNYKLRTSKVVVGYDTRRLSQEAAGKICQVLTANRIRVILAHKPVPSQVISYSVKALRCAAGMMVTASHNPPQFNGIKIKGSFGGPLEKRATDQIERLIFKHKPKEISLSQAKVANLLKSADLITDYLKSLRAYLDLPLLKTGRLKILVDSMHGTADAYIAQILQDTPCKVTTLHQEQDCLFVGIKPEPIQPCLKEAACLMRSGQFDLGLATDGDADRIAALDSQGRFISPQQIIALLGLHLIRYRKQRGAIVKTISGTAVLERIARKYQLKIYETPVGFKYIAHLMQKKNVLIGGEEAGGIGFKNYFPERDGILAGLLLLEMILAQNKPIAALVQDMEKEFGRLVYLRKDLKYLAGEQDKIKERLATIRKKKTFLNTKIARIKDYDGLKFYLSDESWILFRVSGTEPILRIYAESNSLAKAKRLIAEGNRCLKL